MMFDICSCTSFFMWASQNDFDLCLIVRFSIKSALQFNHLLALCVLYIFLGAVRRRRNKVEDRCRWCCNEPYVVVEFDQVLRKFTRFLSNMLDYWIIRACKIEWSVWATFVILTSAKAYLNLIDVINLKNDFALGIFPNIIIHINYFFRFLKMIIIAISKHLLST